MSKHTEYAVIGIREEYGPQTHYRLVAVTANRAEAERLATGHRPDWDEARALTHLAHNQAAGEYGQVAEIVQGPDDPDPWGTYPQDAIDALTAAGRELARSEDVPAPTDEQAGDAIEADTCGAWAEALRGAGYAEIEAAPDPGEDIPGAQYGYYLVRL